MAEIVAGQRRKRIPLNPGELRPEEHIQVGVITRYVTILVKTYKELRQSHTRLDQTGLSN
jgi:hypothetical protein